jgi:hypothetical protein
MLASAVGLQPVQAQTSTPKYSNEFLKIGIGARAAGMGNAMTATANDATAAYWNPAALNTLRTRHEIGLMHAEYFAGVARYDYAGFVTRIDSTRRIGISAIRLGVDDIPNTLNFRDGNSFNYARITEFSVADLAILISYAQAIRKVPGLNIGANIKIVNRTVGDFATAWGFGLDAGVHYQRNNLRLAAMVMDATSTFNAWSFNTETFEEAFIATGNEIPQNSVEVTLPSVRLGVAYQFLPERKINVLAGWDADLTTDGQRNTLVQSEAISLDQRVGIEAAYNGSARIMLRGGVMNFQYVRNDDAERVLSVFPTAGLGIQYKFFQIDYALSNLGGFQDNLYSHLISLRLMFDRVQL